jgi:DNA-binding response OmpR family regulator
MRDPESIDIELAEPLNEAEASMLFADLVLDLDACTLARQSGELIPLTRGEFALLRVLAGRPGRVLSREALLKHSRRLRRRRHTGEVPPLRSSVGPQRASR